MKQIIKIKTNRDDFSIEELWSSYLFSYFFLFLTKNNLYEQKSHNIVIRQELLPDLQRRVSVGLSDLLKDSYFEPSIAELQKHPTRFELLLVEGRKYKVNYRMSETGRMAYAIYNLIKFINNAMLKESDIYIECR